MATPTFIIYDRGVNNPDREVISHSTQFHDWGLRFRDRDPNGQGAGPDAMIFQRDGIPVLCVVIGDGNVGIGTDSPNAALAVLSGGDFNSPQVHISQQTTDFARLRFSGTSANPDQAAWAPWDIAANNGVM